MIEIFIAGILFASILIPYHHLLFSFFQQDEWISLGQVLGGGITHGLLQYTPVQYLAGYNRFLGTLFNNILHFYFPLNPVPFAVVGILLHTANAFLVYLLAKSLLHSRPLAVIAAIFFGITATHHQALTWFASTTTTLPSLFFALVSILSLNHFLNTKRTIFFPIAEIAIVISYLFKESTIFFFPLLFILFFIKKGLSRRSIRKAILLFFPLIIYCFFVLVVRFAIFYSPEGRVGMFVTTEHNSVFLLLKQAVLYPLVGLSQSFIPTQLTMPLILRIVDQSPFSGLLLQLFSTPSQRIVFTSDALFVLLSVILMVVCLVFFVLHKKERSNYFFALLLCIFSFIPLAVVKRDSSSYVDSRYYYLASVGSGILLSLIFRSVIKILPHRAIKIFFCLVLVGYFYKNISLTRAYLLQQNIEGNERKNILLTIKSIYPTLVKKPIFYFTGDSQGYYGVTEQKFPFQQGNGYTLMVLYENTDVIPKQLLTDWFLWDIRKQGYRDVKDDGFGYFYSLKDLEQFLKTHREITSNNVYGFYFSSAGRKLLDITEEVRNKLSHN